MSDILNMAFLMRANRINTIFCDHKKVKIIIRLNYTKVKKKLILDIFFLMYQPTELTRIKRILHPQIIYFHFN